MLKNDLNAEFKSDLINYNGATDRQAYILLGETTLKDTPVRIYYYDASSTATADGEDVVTAVGMGVGRFIKAPIQEFNPGVPSFKRQETYSGSTNGSGVYTVTFGTSYSVAPNIQASIVGGSNTNILKVTSVSTTGFTITVVNRTDVLGLLPTYSNVSGALVDVLVTEK
jgi:hypothetical protein